MNEAGAELLGVGVGSVYPAAVSDTGFFELGPDATPDELAAHFTPIDVRIVGIYRGADEVLNNENSDQGNLALSPAFARRFRADEIFQVAFVELRRGTGLGSFESAARAHLRGIEVQFVSRAEQEQTFSRAVQPYADALRIFALVVAVAGFLVVAQALVRLVAADGSDGPTLDALGASHAMRARRHDLAILQAMGFTRRQVRETVAWQATTLTGVALLVGVPLGILAGGWAWQRFALDLGVEPGTNLAPAVFIGVAVGALLVANVIAAWPARLASRTRPATELRTE